MKEFLSDNSVFIAIAAALFAMTTMIFAILNYFSRNKRNSKLNYYPREALSIISSQSSYFKEFDLKYKGKPILSDIIQIEGKMVCNGKDINSENNRITIIAPSGCEWLDILITHKGNSFALANISKVNQQEAVLYFGKLRRNQSFIINALLQVSNDKLKIPIKRISDVHNSIEFEHSINDTDDVQNITKKDESYFISSGFVFMILMLLSVVMLYLGVSFITTRRIMLFLVIAYPLLFSLRFIFRPK